MASSFLIGLVGGGVCLGILAALTAKFLDSIMDYGSILGGVRYWLAVRYAVNNGQERIAMLLDEARYIEDYHDRLERMNNLYWMLAGSLQKGRAFSWFTGWICISCLTARVSLLVWLLSIPILLKFGASVLGIFTALIVSSVLSNVIVGKL